ncbi:caspase-1-like [Myripristis murdjan]|uniref:caspase-1-like n=1 Tax=Myripristis murdjan TaxID=586833 RepID=UPI001175E3D7|nr:caspase-1-like [Myripristis murdjan]XP_029922806.1 caspase-1-like [Myripristis murdjan]XP_029922807.1 caspase-1-like [Myripristis murdjan]XP_029922808.1 caspase-1-like [Myripristis murdjan]
MADQQLFRARRMFVAKISTPVMADLLNDLLADRILNEREREWVFEEHLARADRASCLIDMVRRKGARASQEMITNLQNIDPLLHNVLFPPVGQADEAAEEQDPPISPVLTLCDENFKTHIQRTDKLAYPVMPKSNRTRVALLINVRNFVNKKWIRKGSEKDDAAMATLLTALGYRVVRPETGEPRKYTGEDIDKAVKDFAQLPDLSQTDSVIVVIMSHGKKGAVYGSRGKAVNPNEKDDLFPIDNIFEYLNAKNCPALRDKPKVIIINACRGGNDGSTAANKKDGAPAPTPGSHRPADTDALEEDDIKVHIEKDFIAFLSCTPGNVSWRHPFFGSPFIQYLVEVFNTFSHKDHLEELFTKVINRFDQGPTPAITQMPVKDRCSLSKHFYLFPGL